MPKGATDQIKELRLARWRRHHAKPVKPASKPAAEPKPEPAVPIAKLKAQLGKVGRPKIKDPRPWEKLGMSRRTWYRKKRGGK